MSGGNCVMVATTVVAESWGGLLCVAVEGTPVSLTGVRRTPIMGA